MAAAGIAQADPMKSMFTAWKYSKGLYILPFLFYYRPLLLNGPVLDVVITIASCTLGLVVAACFLERYLFRKTKVFEQILLGVSAALLLWPPLLFTWRVCWPWRLSFSCKADDADPCALYAGGRMKTGAFDTFSTDLLIIGGGAAGCFAALKAREAGVRNILVVDKGHVGKSAGATFGAAPSKDYIPGEDPYEIWFGKAVEAGCYMNDQDWTQAH